MSYLKTTVFNIITPLLVIGTPLSADDITFETAGEIEIQQTEQAQQTEQTEQTQQIQPETVEEEILEQDTTLDAAQEISPPQDSPKGEPQIIAKFFSADAVQALPRLKAIKNQDPESNKIVFRLVNFPTDKEIFVDIKRQASVTPDEYETKFSFTVGDDGLIQISNSDHRLRALLVGSRGYLPGEMVFIRFHSADGSIDKEISGVPTPAVVYDKEGKPFIRAELVSALPTVYKITLPQVEDGEEYDLKASSVGEVVKSRPKYSKAKGFMYAPAAKGVSKGGDATLEIRRRKGTAYSITLPWGAMLDGYMSGKKIYSPK